MTSKPIKVQYLGHVSKLPGSTWLKGSLCGLCHEEAGAVSKPESSGRKARTSSTGILCTTIIFTSLSFWKVSAKSVFRWYGDHTSCAHLVRLKLLWRHQQLPNDQTSVWKDRTPAALPCRHSSWSASDFVSLWPSVQAFSHPTSPSVSSGAMGPSSMNLIT